MQCLTTSEKKDIASAFLSNEAAKNIGQCRTFLQYYQDVFCEPYDSPITVTIDQPAFETHADVILSFGRLIANPSQSRDEFIKTFHPQVRDQEKQIATRSMLRVAFMLDCASKETRPEGWRLGDFKPQAWQEQQSLASFVESFFPSPVQAAATASQVQNALEQRNRLKAWKLKERYHIRFRPTDNLAEHLLFDKDTRTIKIFRHVKFLKAHLQRSREKPVDLGFVESLGLGTLPPQLLLETLDSIQYLLFPLDEKSARFLDRFVREYNFDPEAGYYDKHVRELPEDFEYKYWARRILIILDILRNPPPAGRFVAWVERHTSERNALTVAILGLFLTALFGFLSFITGAVSMVYSIKQYNAAALASPAATALSYSRVPT